MPKFTADDYDALEFGAEVFGGVGAGSDSEDENIADRDEWGIPICAVCLHGIADYVDPTGRLSIRLYDHYSISRATNDRIISEFMGTIVITKKDGVRLAWGTFTKIMNITRGQ